jgi:secreted Zn-dependent insulinase-like peptidase
LYLCQKFKDLYYTGLLNNGIRIIHRYVDSYVSHCGIIINCGTRDEDFNQHGLAHFVEHMLFKGTKKRKAFHVLSRMDDVGGDIDAWTTKEETVIAASFLTEHYERSIELLNDVVFNSAFPQKELEKEREVIIDEINSYKDSPSDSIFDQFDELLFPDNSLGRNTLGAKSKLLKYNSDDLLNFVKEKYNTEQMVFCSIGKIKFEKLVKYCEKYFGQNPENQRLYQREKFETKTVFNKSEMEHIQTWLCKINAEKAATEGLLNIDEFFIAIEDCENCYSTKKSQQNIIGHNDEEVEVYDDSFNNKELSIENSFEIIPNPNQGNFKIKLLTSSNNCEIRIINSVGQTVKRLTSIKERLNEINITGLKTGYYKVVYIQDNEIIDTQTVIVK